MRYLCTEVSKENYSVRMIFSENHPVRIRFVECKCEIKTGVKNSR